MTLVSTVTITLNTPTSKLMVMRWLRKLHSVIGLRLDLRDAMIIATVLEEGGAWTPVNIAPSLYYTPALVPDFITTVFVRPPDPLEEYFAEITKHRKLLQQGAAGNGDAAIAYCKLELAGEVNHAAFAP